MRGLRFLQVGFCVFILHLLVAVAVAQSGSGASAQQQEGPRPDTQGEAAASAKLRNKKPGAMRIGIAQVTSSANAVVATKPLQGELIMELQGRGLDAIALTSNPDDHDALESEAKNKECDYFVTSDITSYSQNIKAKKTLAGGQRGFRTFAEIAVKAYLPGQMRPVLDGSDHYNGGDAASTLQSLMQNEARSIATEIKKVKP